MSDPLRQQQSQRSAGFLQAIADLQRWSLLCCARTLTEVPAFDLHRLPISGIRLRILAQSCEGLELKSVGRPLDAHALPCTVSWQLKQSLQSRVFVCILTRPQTGMLTIAADLLSMQVEQTRPDRAHF